MLFQILVLGLSLAFLMITWTRRTERRPPGPRGLPLIGNTLQIPQDRQWLKWAEWKTKYGDVIGMSILGTPTVILSSMEAAVDLLESRGNIYSDRPTATMAGELVGWSRGLGYAQASNNPRFRELRRLFHQFMGPRACSDTTLLRIQERENKRLLRKILSDPDNFDAHARNCTSSLILVLTYGYPSDLGDPLGLVKIAQDAMEGFSVASEPGRWWVDSLPALKYIPAWFPGASFQREAQRMRGDLDKLFNVPYQYVKEEIRCGRPNPSFLLSYLEEKNGKETAEEEELVQAFATALYSGGAETTPSALTSFILAMALNPEVQEQAQMEIDTLLSPNEIPTRLPTFEDRTRLPYVSALVKEVWRWNPSVPVTSSIPLLECLPHVVTQDDEYRGYTIEKGSIVWANVWAILHDEKVFPEPFKFRPERYLTDGSQEAVSTVVAAFGICPGMHIAENSVFIAIATILCMFRISKSVDEQGNVVEPVVEYNGFISHPHPFKCKIELRSEGLRSIIETELEH
ncbi:Cytochrome P450 [Mycena sanguinolenta]|uniref:Cytochrome P450 n=1 Tax=Mycena sanguinolenta TaxID=230812 RepID=A0A8H6X5A7_9AGAR|nr:Cytochrome P450 [Mycena sanguinolenta]